MTIDTSKKHRLRDHPESEVQLFPREADSDFIQGRYRTSSEECWFAAEWRDDGRHHSTAASGDREPLMSLDLIPVPDTVKSEGFWLSVEPRRGMMQIYRTREQAEGWANFGEHADPDKPQGAIEYFPPREYEAGSIIDPREEG